MYHHILVPVDLNEAGFADKALRIAIWQAQQSRADLHLLTVIPGLHRSMIATYLPKDAEAKMKVDIQQQLKDFARQNIHEDLVYHLHVAAGKPYTTIIDYAQKLNIDLIIMPSHKRSKIDQVMLGSVASKVVQNSPVNIMVIKP